MRLPNAVWLAAAASVTLLLAVSGRYGFHRDELYFVVAGRRLAWGYVDQPPLTPLVARISELAAGTTPTALRILPALAVGAVVVLAASMARALGGGPKAQVFAAATTAGMGVLLGEGHLLSTAIFDFLFWTAGLWVLVRLLGGADERWWLAMGAIVGAGLQNKHTIAFFAATVLFGLLVSERRRLVSPWPWFGVAIAVLVALPNLAWQAANDWPQLEMASALRARSDGPIAFVLQQPALLSVTLAVPAAAGWWRLARSTELRPWRTIAIAYAALFVTFLATGGKAYYIAPLYSALLAAGGLWFEDLAVGGRRSVAIAAGAGIALGLFVALPLLPPQASGTLDATGELAETVGWPELVEQIAAVHATLSPAEQADVAIFTGSYGEAGAVDVLGRELGLPAATSGHNTYWLWGPPRGDGPIIGVGGVEHVLRPICPDLVVVGTIGNPYGVENEEAGLPLSLCRRPIHPLRDIWPSARHYN